MTSKEEQRPRTHSRLSASTDKPTAPKRLTLAAVRAELRKLGVTIRKQEGEYRVNLKSGPEAQTYYTDDLADALATGKLMGAKAPQLQMGGALNPQEAATVLHSLRLFQEHSDGPEDCASMTCEHFTDYQPLSNKEIDRLCERFNLYGFPNLEAPCSGCGKTPQTCTCNQTKLQRLLECITDARADLAAYTHEARVSRAREHHLYLAQAIAGDLLKEAQQSKTWTPPGSKQLDGRG